MSWGYGAGVGVEAAIAALADDDCPGLRPVYQRTAPRIRIHGVSRRRGRILPHATVCPFGSTSSKTATSSSSTAVTKVCTHVPGCAGSATRRRAGNVHQLIIRPCRIRTRYPALTGATMLGQPPGAGPAAIRNASGRCAHGCMARRGHDENSSQPQSRLACHRLHPSRAEIGSRAKPADQRLRRVRQRRRRRRGGRSALWRPRRGQLEPTSRRG